MQDTKSSRKLETVQFIGVETETAEFCIKMAQTGKLENLGRVVRKNREEEEEDEVYQQDQDTI